MSTPKTMIVFIITCPSFPPPSVDNASIPNYYRSLLLLDDDDDNNNQILASVPLLLPPPFSFIYSDMIILIRMILCSGRNEGLSHLALSYLSG